MLNSEPPIMVRVQPAATPDQFLLTTDDRTTRQKLFGELRQMQPSVKWHVGPGGIRIGSLEVDTLRMLRGLPRFDWTSEASRMLANRIAARGAHARIHAEIRRVIAEGRCAAERLLRDMRSLSVLDDHQWVNVACMTVADGFGMCVFDEQGAGKTVTTIFAFDTLVERDQADFALIIAPKSMVSEWPNDFRRFTADRYVIGTVTGSRRDKRAALGSDADVLVTNFETIVAMEAEIRNVIARYGDRAILIVDESFYAKNLDARRTLAIRRLREWCKRAYVLCGTPAPNAPHDLIQQFNTVDFGITFSGVTIPDDRLAARQVVQQAIEERGLFVRHLKENVLPDLPAKGFTEILVPMQPVQLVLYEDALRGLIKDLKAVNEAEFARQLTSFLARRMALLQVCSHPGAIAPAYTETPAKLIALDELLHDLIHTRGEKVVVWSYFTHSLDAIVSRYSKYNPVRYDGTVTDTAERGRIVSQFQDEGGPMLFAANPAAAGAGLTLHRARIAIYESFSNQAAHYLQSLDRIHRRGQSREVQYFMLLCDRTIEIQEYTLLKQKQRSAQLLLGDTTQPALTREVMLGDATRALRSLLSDTVNADAGSTA
jgi:SNF2 family DNA or RNA helicase